MTARRGTAIWVDGHYVDAACAWVSPFEPHWRAGIGLFESLCVELEPSEDAGRPGLRSLLPRHLSRLRAAAPQVGCAPLPDLDWQEIIVGLLERAALTRGRARLSLRPPAAEPRIVLLLQGLEDFEERRSVGLRLATSSATSLGSNPLPGLKTEARLFHTLAAARARSCAADDALLVDAQGRILETTRANVFVQLEDAELLTPALSDGILPGIARGLLIEALRSSGYSVRERSIHREELAAAREIFVSNGVCAVLPVRALDGRRIDPGPWMDRCLQLLRSRGMPC